MRNFCNYSIFNTTEEIIKAKNIESTKNPNGIYG